MECTSPTEGFNAANETFVDMIAAGIIDPTKVKENQLENFFT